MYNWAPSQRNRLYGIWIASSENSAFKHAQNVPIPIIMRMRKVSSGHLLAIDTLYRIQGFWQRRANAQIRLRIRAVWSGHSLSAHAQKAYFRLARLKWWVLTRSACVSVQSDQGLLFANSRLIWIYADRIFHHISVFWHLNLTTTAADDILIYFFFVLFRDNNAWNHMKSQVLFSLQK